MKQSAKNVTHRSSCTVSSRVCWTRRGHPCT